MTGQVLVDGGAGLSGGPFDAPAAPAATAGDGGAG